jgi:rod shape determining protein RodA
MTASVRRGSPWVQDGWLLASILFLMTIGMLALWSASAIRPGHPEFKRQWIALAVSLPFFFFFLRVDLRIFARFRRLVYLLAVVLLLLVLVAGKAEEGAVRRIDLGPFDLQAGDIALFLMVFTLGGVLARSKDSVATPRGFVVSLLHVLPLMALVVLQPNLSGALNFFAVWMAMSLVSGQRLRYILLLLALLVPLTIFAYQAGIIKPYQAKRWIDYVSGNMGFHTQRALISVGSGELVGQGFGRGELKEARFVPVATTDFIFAVIAEEVGFVGSVIVVAAYAFFLYRVWLVVAESPTRFYRNIAAGIFAIFAYNTLVNLFVVVGLFPVTGVPLPFISYGGTAMVVNLMMVGTLLNLRLRQRNEVF